MLRSAAVASALVISRASASAAHAGIYTDDLSKCLVKSTSETDRTALIVWIFAAMADHPAVKSLATVSPAQHDVANQQAGVLLERLLLTDCRSQTVDAMRYEGSTALQGSFGVLGQVAMAGLMQNKAVADDIAGIAKSVDVSKFASLLTDVGGPAAAASKK